MAMKKRPSNVPISAIGPATPISVWSLSSDAVIAAEFDGVALATLAQRDQVSLSAIKSRTSRGRVMLRDELVKCCQVTLDAASPGLEYDERKLRACAGDAATPAGSDAIQPPAPSRITPR